MALKFRLTTTNLVVSLGFKWFFYCLTRTYQQVELKFWKIFSLIINGNTFFYFLHAVLQTNNCDNSMVFCSFTFLNVFHLSILTTWRQFTAIDVIMLLNMSERCLVYKNEFGTSSVAIDLLPHVPNLKMKFGFKRFLHSREEIFMTRLISVAVMVENLKTFSLKQTTTTRFFLFLCSVQQVNKGLWFWDIL